MQKLLILVSCLRGCSFSVLVEPFIIAGLCNFLPNKMHQNVRGEKWGSFNRLACCPRIPYGTDAF